MIRILIVEDSDVVSLLLKTIFDSEFDMQVIGRARDGREAVQLTQELNPDLVTMDIRMPIMDGFQATRLIMSIHAVPIVVISSSIDDEELKITFRAIEEGALAVLEKPLGLNHSGFEAMRKEMVDTVRSMAEVKVVRRYGHARKDGLSMLRAAAMMQHSKPYKIIAIGCSTGGPQALLTILSALPREFPIPIVVAQHISKGFVSGLVAWLQENVSLQVRLAVNGQKLQPDTVYFAPDNYHLLVERNQDGLVARLSGAPVVNSFRPSATQLFKSVAETCKDRGVGVLLTGMGSDGAEGLLAMWQAGSHTIVQDEASAVVYGMPGSAIALNAVDQIVQLQHMASYISNLVRNERTDC